MASSEGKPGKSSAADLKEFLGFLGNIWGLLAAVTVLFPLSNMLLLVLPILPGAESLSTVLATIFSLFAIFIVFVLRNADFSNEYTGAGIGGLILLAVWMFVFAVIALVAYNYVRLDSWAVGFVPVLYALIFCFFTAAFTFAALAEYIHKEGPTSETTPEEHDEIEADLGELLTEYDRLKGR